MENDKSSDRPVDSSVAQTLEENRSAEAPPSYRDSDRTVTLGSGAQPYPLSPITFTLDLFIEAKDDDISNATLSARDGSELFKVATYHAIIGEERGAGTIVKDASDRVSEFHFALDSRAEIHSVPGCWLTVQTLQSQSP